MSRLIPPRLIELLAGALAGPEDRLRSATVPTELDPLDLVRAGAHSYGWAGYFRSPTGSELGGLGVAWRSNARSGAGRLQELHEAVEAVATDTPLLVGFAFGHQGPRLPEWDGFAPATAVLPLILANSESGTLTISVPAGRSADEALRALTFLAIPEPALAFEAADHVIESRPSPAEWRAEVTEALGAIRSGALEKVVLGRSVTVRTEVPALPFDLLASLRNGYPESYRFGWQEGDAALVGASPELLVARHGLEITSNPLAGSAARGERDQEDERLGRALIASDKDRSEHVFVVEDMAARLEPLTERLLVPSEPQLRKFQTVQHLSTQITGTLRAPMSVLELAHRLHPTPAVGGNPRDEALAFLDKIESIDRGWYGGGIGWTRPDGEGELALALRCGLLRDHTAHLYAGAGIVAASDPEEELLETRLKLRPMLDLLSAS
jgi:salicylate biosynthesis isochorismate synthase/menaquinone-specific isochorismate synthase